MLIELVRRGAAEAPERALVASRSGELTYARCLQRAEALARGLQTRAVGRFACRVDDTGELVALLCAASLTGTEPCMYPPTADDNAVSELARAFDHRLLVTGSARDVPLEIVSPGELAEASGPDAGPSEHSPVLVLTTGTTGPPKGVRHDWGRLAGAVSHPDPRSGARWLLGHNLNQFGGIQVMLQVLVSGATLVVPPSRQPHDVIAAMRDLQVTHASATPTFWRLVAARLDRASARQLMLEQITLGGEAAPASLLAELRELFPAARISHVYATSEFGTVVSVSDGRAGLPLSVLERGDSAPVQLRIEDGELAARSRVGMLGYHGEAEVDEGWRPTGDLVEVRGDRIHFVGRTGDTINVGGVKVHPLPVEDVVTGVDGVALARAYGRPNPITGNVVALDVVAEVGANLEQLRATIQTACAVLPPAAQPRRIRFVDELDVRESKIARTPSAAGA